MQSKYVTSIDWSQKACVLTTEDGQPVEMGQVVLSFRGEPAKVTGGSAPHKSSSTGRVDTDRGSYYPSVYGLKWTPHNQVGI
jgi:hypothetical protein